MEKITQVDVDKNFILGVIDDTNWIYDAFKNDDIEPSADDMSASKNALEMSLTTINALDEDNAYFVEAWDNELHDRQVMLQHLYRKHCIEKTFKKRIPWEAYHYLIDNWKAYANNPVYFHGFTSLIMEDVDEHNFTFFSYRDALNKAFEVQ